MTVDGGNYLQDFTNVDYVTKNIRVPAHGMDEGERREERSAMDSKQTGDKPEDDEEKINGEFNSLLDDIRREVKSEKELQEQKRQLELQKADKLKARKNR